MKPLNLFAALAMLAISLPATAAEDAAAVTLKAGDPAPKLAVSKWVKGGPIDQFEKGKVYIIECWATWCGPCIASMPHVTKLQAKYADKGVVVIGMNVWERNEAAVEPFVTKNAAKMGYAVAMDVVAPAEEGKPKQPGTMASTWLKAAGRNGIPCSFIVDQAGKIAWIGHPMQMDRPLEQVVAGKFDPAEEAKFQEKLDGLSKEYAAAMRAGETDKALTIQDQMIVLNPAMATFYNGMRMNLLFKKGDYAGANALAEKMAADVGDDDGAAVRLAVTLLGAPDIDKIDTALALKMAEKSAAANKESWPHQGVLAKALAANKQYAKAVELQEEVVKHTAGPMKDREEKALADYKEKAAASPRK